MFSICWVLRVIINKEHVYPFKFTDVVTTTTHVPPRTKGGHDLLQGWANGDGALRQDHGAAQETQLWALRQEHCDPVLIAQKVCVRVYMGVTTSQLNELAAETAATLTASQPDYASLATRIVVSNLPPSRNSLCGARK
ncbi:hypothetical protein VPH35_072748 [Triticum aestivum]